MLTILSGASVLSTIFPSLLHAFANTNNTDEIPVSTVATAAFTVLRDLPDSARDGSEKTRITRALESRYSNQDLPLPQTIRSAMALAQLFEARYDLAKEFLKLGPSSTANVDSVKEFLRRYGRANLDDDQVAGVLLFMVLTPDGDQYRPDIFVTALREQFSGLINWQNVIRGFDRDDLSISQQQFLTLYRSLLPISQDNPDFDIQLLWGGRWHYPATQLSFAINLVSLTPEQLDATTIPGLRQAYDPRDCLNGLEDIIPFVEEAMRDPMISLDAVSAIMENLWNAEAQLSPQAQIDAKQVISEKMVFFLCSAAGIPKPWAAHHQQLLTKMATTCLLKTQQGFKYILHSWWKQDKHWMATKLIEAHSEDPLKLPLLLEHAQEHGWLEDLCTMMNGFGIDLAALAHREGLIDMQQWADEKLERGQSDLTAALSKFLIIKAEDEMRTVHGNQPAPRTVSLAMKTVYSMLEILEEHVKDRREELVLLERQCLQAFPRLCNYGEGYDEIIESSGAQGNMLPPSAEERMQDTYKKMYSAVLDVRNVIEGLRDCKTSSDPSKQDFFACMIHGLFDEFVCFSDYPLGPLATTAVLFGGIINYRLANNFALRAALEMVLESVRDYTPESSMYKFGLQALLHFLGRLPEWPEFCQRLVQVPGLQGTEPYARAQDVLREHKNAPVDANGVENGSNGHPMTNGTVDDTIASDSLVTHFRSVNADSILHPEDYEDPTESVQEKFLFVLNNISEQNIATKTSELMHWLERKHHQWFAAYLVEQRAKSQPNYQQLYLDMLGILNSRELWADVLRETYVSVRKLLNAEATMKLPGERTNLKNLGTWLGSLTIARDKPIKHKNIAFKELLIEGWETQRLLLVIPFTCEVLAQGVKSVVFKPPNPWVMEVIGLLLELYDLPETKLQQKFAIEILLSGFGLPRKGEGMERSNELRKRQEVYEQQIAPESETMDAFDDMGLGSISKGLRSSRFSPSAIASALPDMMDVLVVPSTSSNPARLRQIVSQAVQRSIMEIIGPVVERSVTIATIATNHLVHKDYAQEPDEDRIRDAFETIAKELASSLASVTCKEPLRMSMTNYIRMAAAELTDQSLPEGSVLMCVNDNLEAACKVVEKQAEDRAMPEIEPHIEVEIAKRRQHKADFPNEPYRDPITSHWSTYIPEPYKQTPGGLNQQQLDLYQNFGAQIRGTANHGQNASTDSGKQIPDVLQDANFPAVPTLPTPAEAPALPHQPQGQQQGRILQPSLGGARQPSQLNGYVDSITLQEHISESLHELTRLTRDSSEQHFKDISRDSIIVDVINRIISFVTTPQIPSQEKVALTLQTASIICSTLYTDPLSKFDAEVLVYLLKQLCLLSESTGLKVVGSLRNQNEDRILNIPATVALLEHGLMEFSQVDVILSKALDQKNLDALNCLSSVLDSLLFAEDAVGLRADFARSLGAVGLWLSEDPNLDAAKMIFSKLKSAGIPENLNTAPDFDSQKKQNQMQYIFQEWLGLFARSELSDPVLVTFAKQFQEDYILSFKEDMTLFLRLSIDNSVQALEQSEALNHDPSDAYVDIDALARLVVLFVRTQGQKDKDGSGSRARYLKSLLSLIVLVLNNHHVMRGEQFSQRAFFRLFSTIFYEWHDSVRGIDLKQDRETVLVFAETLLALEPRNFPAFTHGWLHLISHRVFMPAILKFAYNEGSDLFSQLMETMLWYVSDLLKVSNISPIAIELYRGVLRILLVLHHDFPEFLAENHYRLCNAIPPHCTQLRNLVLSAFPSSMLELPDPFAAGLKVDRLDDIKKSPAIAGDFTAPLRRDNLKDVIDNALSGSGIIDDSVAKIVDAIDAASKLAVTQENRNAESALLHAIVLHIGQSAITSASTGPKNGMPFTNDTPHATLLNRIAKELEVESRHHFLSAIVNQLRYPNSHTHFFSYALLHLFGTDQADQEESDIRHQITRVLLERLIVHRPHPWGLIITLLELLKNPVYQFWEHPFIKAAPEVSNTLASLLERSSPLFPQ